MINQLIISALTLSVTRSNYQPSSTSFTSYYNQTQAVFNKNKGIFIITRQDVYSAFFECFQNPLNLDMLCKKKWIIMNFFYYLLIIQGGSDSLKLLICTDLSWVIGAGGWNTGILLPSIYLTYLAGSRHRFSQLQQFAIRLNIAVRVQMTAIKWSSNPVLNSWLFTWISYIAS